MIRRLGKKWHFFQGDYFSATVEHSCDQQSVQCLLYSFVQSQVADTPWLRLCLQNILMLDGRHAGCVCVRHTHTLQWAKNKKNCIDLSFHFAQIKQRLFVASDFTPTSRSQSPPQREVRTHTRAPVLDATACRTHTQGRTAQTRLGMNPPLPPRGLSAGGGKRRH